MAITTAMCNTFKKECLEAKHNFLLSGGSTFKLALIKNSMAGTYSKSTTNYSDVTGNSDEVANGSGYTTGGETLTRVDPSLDSDTAITDFADVQWGSATFSADGCITYNSSDSNSGVGVFDFGGTKTASGGNFDLTMPAAAAATAIVRFA
jgi:hypothetical protein